MKYKDYYATMGVPRNASQDDIKHAYRKLARTYHPDKNQAPEAETRFKEIGEAYEVLKDPDKRVSYDRFGNDWKAGQEFRPPPGWNGAVRSGNRARAPGGAEDLGTGFSDFFETLFGAGAPRAGFGTDAPDGRGRARADWGPVHVRGRDQAVNIQISLEDAFGGSERTLSLQDSSTIDGRPPPVRNLKVRIPKGTMQGQTLRLEGQGRPGHGGAPNGDLMLEVNFAPHPLYRAEGRDIYMELPVTPWEAALGARVKVPTLGGAVEMQVPAGSQSGNRLRLKGRGLPGPHPGDQYASLSIVAPPAETEQAREFYRQMEAALPFDPRARM